METTLVRSLLPEEDVRYLSEKRFDYSEEAVNGWIHIIFENFRLPAGYTPQTCRLLIRIPPGYPNANPDMFWTRPDIRLHQTGALPRSSEHHETYSGQSWQRWSRHVPQNTWRAGRDNLQTFLRTVQQELLKGI
jgi:hypothetical protein